MKRLGLLVYGSPTGLGNQTKEYFDHLNPSTILGVDISQFNKKPINKEWYPDSTRWTNGLPSNEDCEYLVDNSDTILIAETPINYHLFSYAKRRGVKTILVPNYEFLDYLNNPNLPLPDILACPSTWHIGEIIEYFSNRCTVLYLPVPVNRKKLPYRKVEQAIKFIHIAGWKLFEDRNGTDIVMQALPHVVNKKIHFIIYCQEDLLLKSPIENCEIRLMNHQNYWDLYSEGDVLLLPRRYGGLSLQLNEAMSCGIVPLMPEIAPQDRILHPRTLLFPTMQKDIYTRTKLECFTIDPIHLAHRIDLLASQDIFELSEHSNTYAESISWETLLPKYREIL